MINNTLLKPLPFPDPDRLVLVFQTYGKGTGNWASSPAPNFWDFERQSHSFENMAIFDSAGRGYNLAATGNAQEAEQVSGLRVSAGFFSVLGVKPFLGRTLRPEEETLGNDHEVVLSYGLWKQRWVLVGIAAGVAGSAGLTRLLAGLLYDVRPLDPAVLGAVSLLLAAVALVASYLPARRAAKIDPIVALRCD